MTTDPHTVSGHDAETTHDNLQRTDNDRHDYARHGESPGLLLHHFDGRPGVVGAQGGFPGPHDLEARTEGSVSGKAHTPNGQSSSGDGRDSGIDGSWVMAPFGLVSRKPSLLTRLRLCIAAPTPDEENRIQAGETYMPLSKLEMRAAQITAAVLAAIIAAAVIL